MEHILPDKPEFGVPALRPVNIGVLREALSRGWHDLKRAPSFAVVFAGVYVVLGWSMVWITWSTGQTYWLIFAAFGFPLIAPIAAVAFYDVSRRLGSDRQLKWLEIMRVIAQQSNRQLPSMSVIIILVFLFWFFLGHMIFALFLGLSTMTNVSSSLHVFLSREGLAMLAFGSLVGAAIATLLYMITVISLPLLLDREVDFVTAMITSFSYVRDYPAPMFGWAIFIAVFTFVSMLPGFLGLFVSLPLLGHATWHLYDILAYGTDHPQDTVSV